jgi:hypothetical protein
MGGRRFRRYFFLSRETRGSLTSRLVAPLADLDVESSRLVARPARLVQYR